MKEKQVIKKYQKEDLTVVWEPSKCIHSKKCWQELPTVFKPMKRPWIQLETVGVDAIKSQIERCPSGALSYINQEKQNNMEDNQDVKGVKVEVIPGGPLAVHSTCTISHADGSTVEKENKAFFCRCGASTNKPFCDGTHKTIEFDK